jgi:BirA family biotin operon repressor/biotin-[acetyl-CoA-carboxylase] ligase
VKSCRSPPTGIPAPPPSVPRVQITESTDSTNADVLAAAGTDAAGWPHLSVLLTTDQRAGRGRLDRSWTTPPGTALAMSVVVRVPALPIAARGWIPLVAGAAMVRAVGAQLRGTPHSATLKWPNDVLIDGGKVCGILAEVVPGDPDTVVVGAGVNTRMTRADLPVDTAVSFAALGLTCDDDRLVADFLSALDEQLSALVAGRGDAAASGVSGEVSALCSTLGADVAVQLPDGTRLTGRAARLDADGRLVVEDATGLETAVSAGDVVHVR